MQREILADPILLKAIDVEFSEESELINTHIFTFAQNPKIIQSSSTYLTIQVHIPRGATSDNKWVHPILEIWIISHNKHMRISNISGVRANRNDFIAQLLDEKFNGSSDFGYGQMYLERNIEGVHPDNNDYLYRQMVFVTKDLNQGVCR